MLRIKNEGYLQGKLKGLLYKIFSKLENNNNADFYSNGEDRFLRSFLKNYSNKKITLFDVGANIGKYSEMVLKYCKEYHIDYRIHLFEPVHATVEILKSKFSQDPGMVINAVGLSNENKTAEIFYDEEGSSLASLYQRELSQANIFLNKKETIRLVRLDSYMEAHQIKKIDFLKIDVEGHEISAFDGMGKYLDPSFISAIQFEYGGANIDSRTFLKNLYSLFLPKGFDICKIKRGYLEKRTYDVRMENFAYANYVAIRSKPDV